LGARAKVDPRRYGRLLVRSLPAVIETEEENERLAVELEKFDQRFHELSPEEKKLAELITLLIEDFEEKHYALNASTPLSRLKYLMEERGLKQRDLLSVFGSSGIASEVFNGKRGISKGRAQALAQFFRVAPDLFR